MSEEEFVSDLEGGGDNTTWNNSNCTQVLWTHSPDVVQACKFWMQGVLLCAVGFVGMLGNAVSRIELLPGVKPAVCEKWKIWTPVQRCDQISFEAEKTRISFSVNLINLRCKFKP